MSEIINTYKLDDAETSYPMDRKKFYDEQIEVFRKTGKPSLAVGIFNAFLFTPQKEMILQKRSHTKRHNPRLIDKTVGGHLLQDKSPFYTAMIECVQELQIPTVVLRKKENERFSETLEILSQYLESVAILEQIDNQILEIDNIFDGERVTIAKNVWVFMGVYSGPIKPADREAAGVLYYEVDALREEMKATPDIFTPDLHYFMKNYEGEIEEFLKQL